MRNGYTSGVWNIVGAMGSDGGMLCLSYIQAGE